MSLIKRFYLLFLFLILVPGLFLGYLSLKTIQYEKNLIIKSNETAREDFVEFIEKTAQEFEREFIETLKNRIIKSSTSASQKNYFFLSTDLLNSPYIHSLIILEQGEFAMPLMESVPPKASPEITPELSRTVQAIQRYYREKNYRETLRWIQRYHNRFKDIQNAGPLGANYTLGFKLLRIKCYKALGEEENTVAYGMELVNEILSNRLSAGFRQKQYFLNEVISNLSSTENLSKKIRDQIWDINLRIDSFYANLFEVLNHWKLDPDFLTQISGKTLSEGILVFYLEGNPYIKIQFPWIDSRTQVIAKLDQDKIVDLAHSKTTDNPKGRWRSMEYAIYNLNNILIHSPFGTKDKISELERILNSDILQWKVSVFKSTDNEKLSVGMRKITLLYILTGFALVILFLGIITGIKGIIDEKKMVKMKTNFLSAVTHELKTPLTSIRLLSELVESGRQVDGKRIKKYANLIGQESNRLQGMIDNILNSTRLETKNLKSSMKPLNLTELIREVTDLMAKSFERKNIQLSQNLENHLNVLGDRESLRSVVQNLLDNALKYSPEGSRVDIRVRKSEGAVVLTVRDNGIGIPASALKHIFEKFYRAEDEMTRESQGTGLGLSLVKQILDFHNAEINVKSKEEEGTEFVIVFPVKEPMGLEKNL